MIEVTNRRLLRRHSPAGGHADRDGRAAEAADGFILVPHVTPGGLDEFADSVVPILQERGQLPLPSTSGPTLRDHLGSARAARGGRSFAEPAHGGAA